MPMPSAGGATSPDQSHTTLRIHSVPEPESAELEELLARIGRALGSHVVRIYLRPAKPELLDGRLVLHPPAPREFDWFQRNEPELNKAAGIEVVMLREKKR
jgi:hypothetical protein